MPAKLSKPLPPGPRSLLPGRVFRELRRDPLAFLTQLTQTYGDISSFSALGQRYVILNHPDLAREILINRAGEFWKGPALQNSKGILGEGLLTAEGELHKQQRRLMQPAFHAKYVEQYAEPTLQSTHELLATWEKSLHHADSAALDIRPDLMGLTLVIAGRALFGTLLADEIQTVHRCMDDLMNNYVRSVVPWGKLLNLIPSATTRKLKKARAELVSLVDRMIAARRTRIENVKSNAGKDLLSTMIAATDPEGNGQPKAASRATRLTDRQLRDQCITILTAGHETTANAMTFTLYLLARHPDVQAKLRGEVQSVLGTLDPSPAIFHRLPFTRQVLSESMRLYPPAWTLGRQNRQPIEIGGYRLPRGCTILLPQWTLHRDPRFWPEPLCFRPERWQSPAHPRFAYIPFSTGPRNCIGESFAWLEMMLVLPLLVREFHFAIPPAEPEIRLTPAITLRPKGPVRVILRRVGIS